MNTSKLTGLLRDVVKFVFDNEEEFIAAFFIHEGETSEVLGFYMSGSLCRVELSLGGPESKHYCLATNKVIDWVDDLYEKQQQVRINRLVQLPKFRARHAVGGLLEGTTSAMFRWVEDGQPVTLEQYTERKDRNGYEIYQRDIVKAKCTLDNQEIIGEVKFEGSEYVVESEDSKWPVASFTVLTDFEILGNMTDSPELLGIQTC